MPDVPSEARVNFDLQQTSPKCQTVEVQTPVVVTIWSAKTLIYPNSIDWQLRVAKVIGNDGEEINTTVIALAD